MISHLLKMVFGSSTRFDYSAMAGEGAHRRCHVWMAPVWQCDFYDTLKLGGSGAVMSSAFVCDSI